MIIYISFHSLSLARAHSLFLFDQIMFNASAYANYKANQLVANYETMNYNLFMGLRVLFISTHLGSRYRSFSSVFSLLSLRLPSAPRVMWCAKRDTIVFISN